MLTPGFKNPLALAVEREAVELEKMNSTAGTNYGAPPLQYCLAETFVVEFVLEIADIGLGPRLT